MQPGSVPTSTKCPSSADDRSPGRGRAATSTGKQSREREDASAGTTRTARANIARGSFAQATFLT